MSFIINLLIYLGFAYVMSEIAKRSYGQFGDEDMMDKYEWYYIIFFTALVAFSWNTGVDSFAYAIRFMRGFIPEEFNTEHIYNNLTNFIADSPLPYWTGMAILGFCQIFPLVKSLENNRYILIMLPFVLFGNCYFLTYMNGMRQMVVASVFVYACRFIYERKMWIYLAIIFTCSFIHQSAMMLLPLYLFAYTGSFLDKVGYKRTILLIVYIVCVIMGYTPSFQGAISYVEDMTSLVGYDNYAGSVSEYLGGGYDKEVHNFGLMMISYFLIGCFVIWYGPMLKEKYGEKIPLFNLWYFLAVAYGCLYFMVVNVSHLFIRPVLYLIPFQLIILSLLLWELYDNLKLRNIAILLTIVIWMECGWNLYKNQTPYSSANYHLSWLYDLSKYKRK